MKIKVELGGGLELLFNKVKEHELVFSSENVTINDVIKEMSLKIVKDKELFVISTNDEISIKPGIIVLYNDADWEIYEKEKTKLENNDAVAFISTLHGG